MAKRESFIAKLWSIIYPMLIYFGITMVISIVFSTINAIIIQADMLSTGNALDVAEYTQRVTEKVYEVSMLMTFLAAIITIPIMILFYRTDIKKRKQEYDNRPSLGWYLPIILVSGLACISVNSLIGLSHISDIFPGFNEVAKALYGGNIVWEILAACIAAPVVEELIFRGLIYSRIRQNIKPIYAMIISSLLFGAYHMNVVQGIYAFVIGMLFAFIYEKYKTIWAPILSHVSANAISVLISETGILNSLFENMAIQIIITIVGLVIGIYLLYSMKKNIEVDIIDKNPVMYDLNGKVIG